MKQSLIIRYIKNIKSFIASHKIWSVVIILFLVFIGYKVFAGKTPTEIRYVTSVVTKGTVVSSVTGSGQVEATSTIDLKPKVSGDVVSVNTKAGSLVKKGQTLFVLDAGDAQKSLRDAKLNLQIAENDLANAKKDYENTKNTQEKSLKNLLINLNSSVVAVPDEGNTSTNIINLSGSYSSTIQGRYILEVYGCKNGFCISYSGLESGSFPVDNNVPQALGLRGLYATFTSLPKENEKWYVDVPSLASNSYASNLKAYEDGKESIPQAIDTAYTNVTSKEIALTQKQNALADIKQELSDYYITAPFDGTIASITALVGQQASSGASLGSIITNQKLASITLNEVDVAKVKLGQKVTLTFDAISDLSIAGEIVQIDSVGTVTQGVVNYTVKISFATEDDRVKPGMSVGAAIITDIAQDVLTVPNSAVKTQNGSSYVEMFNAPLEVPAMGVTGSISKTLPIQQIVEIGLSNDTSTEIKSGLKEGDQVVSRTITTQVAKTTTAPSLIGGNSTRGATGGNALRSATGR